MAESSYEEVIDFVLRRNADAITAGMDSLHAESPLEALMRAEEEGDGEEWAIKQEAFRELMEFLAGDGPDPLEVVRRYFALAKALTPHLLGDMTCTDIALLCGDATYFDPDVGAAGEWVACRATVSARIKRIYGKKLKEGGMRATKAPFQKSEEAGRKFSKAQMGNKNRVKNQRRRKRK